MIKAPFTDDELRAVIKESVDRELEIFRSYADYPEHPFRDEIENKMETLCRNVENGNITSAVYHMGFAFYAKRCIAAALIILAIAGVTMPDTVIAAYHKLIEVVETVFEEYTEFRYYNPEDNSLEESDFDAIEIQPLSEEWNLAENLLTENSLIIVYENGEGQYVRLYQKFLPENYNILFTINTENSEREIIKIKGEKIEFMYEEELIQFIWEHEGYYIKGKTNLSKDKIIELLKCVQW